MAKIQPPVADLKFDNIAREVGERQDQRWFEWTVFVDEGEEVLEQIEAVEYLLHRTFPNPLRKQTNPEDKFSISGSGWGEFTIKITVFFDNGGRLETSYYLDLSRPWDESMISEEDEE